MSKYKPKIRVIRHEKRVIKKGEIVTDEVFKYVDTTPYESIVVHLTDIEPEYANALRRMCIDEKTNVALTFERHNLVTNDPYIVYEELRNRIGLIPLDQSFLHRENTPEYTLDIENKSVKGSLRVDTDDIGEGPYGVVKTILSGEIAPKIGAQIPFPKNIRLAHVFPGCHVKINNIRIERGRGVDNSVFSPAVVEYRVLDETKSYTEDLYDYSEPPRDFELIVSGINIQPRQYVIDACAELIEHVEQTARIIAEQTAVSLGENSAKYAISDESHTVGALFSKTIYLLDPSINYVAYRLRHPSERELELIVTHSDSKKIVETAAKKIVEVFTDFITSLRSE